MQTWKGYFGSIYFVTDVHICLGRQGEGKGPQTKSVFEAFPCDVGPCVGVSNAQEAGVEDGKEKECLVCTIFTCAELELGTTMMINDSRE